MNTPIRKRERGSVTILMAASLIFFFGFVALAVDIGFLYMTQRRAQAIADLAAIAGASRLGVSQAAAQNASQAIETQNGYPTVTATFPTAQRIQVALATPAKSLFFGRIFGVMNKTLHVTAVASSGTPVPAIWAGGGCGSANGIQLNGGPFTLTGNVVSNGPINYYTGAGNGPTYGDVKNSSACALGPNTTGAVSGTTGQDAPGNSEFTDPFGYNMATDFPACTVNVVAATYNVPISGAGVITPGVYCVNGNVNISSGAATMTGVGVTVLATGQIMASGNGLTISPAANAHNIVFFSTSPGTVAGACTGIPAVGVGSPGATINGSVYAPNGCINMSGNNFELDGSMIGNQVAFGSGGDWTVDASAAGVFGSIALYQ